MDDGELLAEYAASGSEEAFAELVGRHLALVHSTALRIVENAQLAEEVAQSVFIILARKAGHMRKGTILSERHVLGEGKTRHSVRGGAGLALIGTANVVATTRL